MTPTKEELADRYADSLGNEVIEMPFTSCKNAFLAGYKTAEEMQKELMDDVVHVLSLASLDNFSRRELAFEAKLLLQKIRMRDE